MAIFAAMFVSNLFWLVVIGLVIEGFYAQGALVMIMSPFLFKKEDGAVPSEIGFKIWQPTTSNS